MMSQAKEYRGAERWRSARWISVLAVQLLIVGGAWANTELPRPEAERLAQSYLASHRAELGLEPSDIGQVEVTDAYTSSDSGVQHVYLRQKWQGIEVYGANFTLNLSKQGAPFFVGDRFLRGLAGRIASPAVPALTAQQAVEKAAQHLRLGAPHDLKVLHQASDKARTTRLTNGGVSRREIPAHLVWAEEKGTGRLRLAWDLEIEPREGAHYWSVRIDAATGAMLDLADWVDQEEYRVYPIPIESPDHTTPAPPADGRTLVVDPYANGTGSPYGWHDTDGVAGAEYTTTEGNNVKAYTDWSNTNTGTPEDCGSLISCDFSLDLTQDPDTNPEASVTNLFYWVNIAHDVLYQYGFDEASGNFQVNNYGHGGQEGDSVQAEAQDSDVLNPTPYNRCNANFFTPPDGQQPRLQVYVCTNNTNVPTRDTDFDDSALVHEYGHGLSNRLTGGPSITSCLNNGEQMGEGWSDFLGLMLTMRTGDAATDPRPFFTYSLGQPVTGPGARPAPYTTDMVLNPSTYGDLSHYYEVHDVGFVWATMLWDMTWKLIDAHGFNPNIYDDWSTGGNNLALQLVIDGMELQSCSPGFVDGRDAILAADQALTGGENQCLIWSAFAKRGLGYSASEGSPEITSDAVAAFDLPEECEKLTADPPERKICAGNDASFNIGVHQAFTPPVTLSVPSPPSGVSVLFSPNPVDSALPASSTLTLGNTDLLPLGTDTVTVHGDDSSLTDDLDLKLRVFTTPGASSLVAPADGATEVPLRPLLSWQASDQGDEYLLEVDDDPAFGSPEISETLSTTELTPAVALAPETTYYWRVVPSNPCGDGPATASRSFKTAPAGKILPPVPIDGAAFGSAVAIRDDLLAIGAPLEDSAGKTETGAVYLYGRNVGGADAWGLISTFYYPSPSDGDHFGAAVAVDADTLIVGAPGANGGEGRVVIFDRNEGGADKWGEETELKFPGWGSAGTSLALDGDFLVVGAPGDDTGGIDSGAVSIWHWIGGSWTPKTLTPPAVHAGDHFGAAVAISHGWVAVGAPGDDTIGTDAGRVLLFERNTGGVDNWGYRTAQSPLEPSPDGFLYGSSLSMDLDTLMVGVPGSSTSGEPGSVRVLMENQGGAGAWGELQKITANDETSWNNNQRFGVSVGVHGDLAVVGRTDSDHSGAVYLYENSAMGSAPWVEVTPAGASDDLGGGFGNAVAIDDGTVAVGSLTDDVGGVAHAGSAYVIQRQPTSFSQTSKVLAPAAGYELGTATAISGDTMVATGRTDDPTVQLPVVYRRDATGRWAPVATLQPTVDVNNETLGYFGFSVAIDGDIAVVGDPEFVPQSPYSWGAAFVFERNQGGADHWGEVARLVASDRGNAHESTFGWSVAVDGDLIAVGDQDHQSDPNQFIFEGAVYLYRRNQSAKGPVADAWGQVGPYITSGVYASDGDEFGESVALSGRHLLVGAAQDQVSPENLYGDFGVGYLFDLHGGAVIMKSRLLEPNPDNLDGFGWAVDIDGADAWVDAAENAGVHVYSRNVGGADAWNLVASPCAKYDCTQGGAIDGGLIAAGEGNGTVPVLAQNQGGADQWGHAPALDIVPSDSPVSNRFGLDEFDIGLDRGNAVVGASADGSYAGAAYVFHLEGSWSVTPPRPPLIFADGFQSGDTSAWSAVTGG